MQSSGSQTPPLHWSPCAPKPSKSSTETSASIQGEGDEEGREGERGRRKEGLGRWWDRSLEPGPGSNTGCFFVCFLFGHTARLVGSQFSNQGSNPRPLQWQHSILTTGPLEKSWKQHISLLPYIPLPRARYIALSRYKEPGKCSLPVFRREIKWLGEHLVLSLSQSLSSSLSWLLCIF